MTRGCLYITFDGDPRVFPALERSIGSLRQHHPDIEISEQVFAPGTLLDKAKMLDLSPFDTTLFLDADTVVLGNLDFAFEKAEQFGLACAICECPWARRFGGLHDRGDIVEYNTGVLAFTQKAAPVFDAWKRHAPTLDSSVQFRSADGVQTMSLNDQAAFALAVHETGFNPFVLPLNWNYRPIWQHTAFGPIKIFHDYSDVPKGLLEWNTDHAAPGSVFQCGLFKQSLPQIGGRV